MTATKEITSITKFMDWVRECTQSTDVNKSETPAFFYRGHADTEYQLQPSVYRTIKGKSYRAVESQLYQGMLHRNPNAFSEDKTLFERLVRMQHHGLPTRLLDVTQSPLVALYFACCEYDNENGKVMFFGMPQLKVEYSSSIPQVALAGVEKPLTLSRLGFGITDSFKRYFEAINKDDLIGGDEEFNDAYHTFLSSCIDWMATVTEFTDILLTNEILKKLTQDIDAFKVAWRENLTRKARELQNGEQREKVIQTHISLLEFNEQLRNQAINTITCYCKQINIPYDSDWDCFDKFLPQFTHFYFVYPPLNNERIRRQQGAFLVFPPVESAHWTASNFHTALEIKTCECIIKAKDKYMLLQELANMGITEGYLFPELEKQAEDIKLRYPPS